MIKISSIIRQIKLFLHHKSLSPLWLMSQFFYFRSHFIRWRIKGWPSKPLNFICFEKNIKNIELLVLPVPWSGLFHPSSLSNNNETFSWNISQFCLPDRQANSTLSGPGVNGKCLSMNRIYGMEKMNTEFLWMMEHINSRNEYQMEKILNFLSSRILWIN